MRSFGSQQHVSQMCTLVPLLALEHCSPLIKVIKAHFTDGINPVILTGQVKLGDPHSSGYRLPRSMSTAV